METYFETSILSLWAAVEYVWGYDYETGQTDPWRVFFWMFYVWLIGCFILFQIFRSLKIFYNWKQNHFWECRIFLFPQIE